MPYFTEYELHNPIYEVSQYISVLTHPGDLQVAGSQQALPQF
jgi:hypothetical protein